MTRRSLTIALALSVLLSACASDASVPTTTAPAVATTAAATPTTTALTDTTSRSRTTAAPEPTTTTAAVPDVVQFEISYLAGQVEGGGRLEIPLGEVVLITIESDVADEGHLHGYDIFVDLEPGAPGSIEFVADIPGIFELELEGSGVLLADLEVAP